MNYFVNKTSGVVHIEDPDGLFYSLCSADLRGVDGIYKEHPGPATCKHCIGKAIEEGDGQFVPSSEVEDMKSKESADDDDVFYSEPDELLWVITYYDKQESSHHTYLMPYTTEIGCLVEKAVEAFENDISIRTMGIKRSDITIVRLVKTERMFAPVTTLSWKRMDFNEDPNKKFRG